MAEAQIQTNGWGCKGADCPLEKMSYSIPSSNCGCDDGAEVHIKVMYCGVCHSDIHVARNHWGATGYPLVPGHEMTGRVHSVGPRVTKFKVGDLVGVGCLVGSCDACRWCAEDAENYCDGRRQTYNWKRPDGSRTAGGYGQDIVVPERFVLRIPKELPMDKAAPLLCAGTTTYVAITRCGFDVPIASRNSTGAAGSAGCCGENTEPTGKLSPQRTRTVGVVGIGGLGHMAIQFLKAFGNDVVAISTSDKKKATATACGAKHFLVSSDAEATKAWTGKLDGIIYTAPVLGDHLQPMVQLLDARGKLCILGVPEAQANSFTLAGPQITVRGRELLGSNIGGLAETQQMLNFCAEHNIAPYIETIPMSRVNEAYERTIAGDVQFRFVLDVEHSLE